MLGRSPRHIEAFLTFISKLIKFAQKDSHETYYPEATIPTIEKSVNFWPFLVQIYQGPFWPRNVFILQMIGFASTISTFLLNLTVSFLFYWLVFWSCNNLVFKHFFILGENISFYNLSIDFFVSIRPSNLK